MIEKKVSNSFVCLDLICIYILVTPKASGVTQYPVTDNLCDDEDWIGEIIAEHFCLSSNGEISLVDDNHLLCDIPDADLLLEEETMIHGKAKSCSPEISRPRPTGGESRCKKIKVQPPPSPKRNMCKEGAKIKVLNTVSGTSCVADKAIPAFLTNFVDFPECKERKPWKDITSVEESTASAITRRAISPCGRSWKQYKTNLCRHEGSLYVWDVPSLGRLCRVETDERINFRIQNCSAGVIQFLHETVALTAQNVDPTKIPECSPYQVYQHKRLGLMLCFFAGTFYLWKPPSKACKKTASRPVEWNYCTLEAVRVMQIVAEKSGPDEIGSDEVAETFMVCTNYVLRQAANLEGKKCAFEGWLFLWQEKQNVLCLIRTLDKRDRNSAACPKSAVGYIESVKEISKTQVDTSLIPVCSSHIMQNRRYFAHKTCFFKGLYLVIIENNGGHVCRRPNAGRDLFKRQYCFEDDVNMIIKTLNAATSDRAASGPSNAQSYDVSMKLKKRPKPSGDDTDVRPQSKRFKQIIRDMVNASCPPDGFVDMHGYTITPLEEASKQKRFLAELYKRNAELIPGTNFRYLLAKMRQNTQLADGYQISFTVLIQKVVAEESDFSQVELLLNLKQNSRTFDGGAYIVDSNSIEVHKVSEEPPDGAWRRRATWIVGGVTCAALVLLSTIIISWNIRSRRTVMQSGLNKHKRNIFKSFA